LGTPAITTRGFKEDDARQVANLILQVIDNPTDEKNLQDVSAKVEKLTADHPINQ
ncbi:serine hydroxymethyltransferase, partial [Lentilactobacillus parabuchneri]